jgi:hypothetical protein
MVAIATIAITIIYQLIQLTMKHLKIDVIISECKDCIYYKRNWVIRRYCSLEYIDLRYCSEIPETCPLPNFEDNEDSPINNQ